MQPDETQDPLALALSLDLAPTLAPDDAAANAVLAKRYQLPVGLVQQYHADYKKQAWYEDAITTTKQSPVLRSFLTNENRAQVMQDDLPNLAKMEGAATSVKPPFSIWAAPAKEPTVGDIAHGIGMALPQGVRATMYGLGSQFGDALGWEGLSEYSAQQARLVQKSIKESTPEFDSRWAQGLYSGATSTARLLPALAASIGTKNPSYVLAAIGLQTEAEAYSKYKTRGATSAEGFVGAMGEGAVEVATELLPMGFMMRTLGKTGMGTFLTGLLAREIPTEQMATLLQDAIDTSIANPDTSWGDFWRARPGAAVETLFATLVPTAFFGVLHKAVETTQNHRADVQFTTRITDTFQALSELSMASKVRPRPGQTFTDYIESVTDGTPIQEVSLSPQMLQQSGHAEELMTLSPSIRAQYESSLTMGTDIVIPIAEYLSTIAPTKLGELLLDDLKVPGESMTRKEAREYVSQQSTAFDAVIAAQVSQHLTRTDLDASSRVVGDKILAQLQGTTRYTKEQAKDVSVLIRSFYETTALKAGMLPDALFAQIPYSVQGAGIPSTGTLTQAAFAEANYRPEVSAWAKTQFGDRTAPNNSAVWQNFTRWFGDSKVFDGEGNPLVVYHGTPVHGWKIAGKKPGEFDVFDRMAAVKAFNRTPGMDSVGSWFSDNPGKDGAQRYSGSATAAIYPVYLSIKNPWQPASFNEFLGKMNDLAGRKFRDGRPVDKMPTGLVNPEPLRAWLKQQGYDGIMFPKGMRVDGDNQAVWVALDPTQIKSVTGNNGDFDITNQSILTQPARDRSVDEIHTFATANQIPWNEDPAFMDFTESVTGKRTLDTLTQPERNRLYAALESRVAPSGQPGGTGAATIPSTEEKDWTKHEPTVTSTGTMKGAPDWVKTARQKTKMRQMLRQFVQEGLAGRYWYEQSARGIMTLVGGNVQLAEKFIQLIAVYSPNSNVWANTLAAVKAFTHWRLGRSAETFKVGMPDHDQKAVAILYRNASWDGRKTNSFYLNLMYEIVQTYPEQVAQLNLPSDLTAALAHTSTIDVWMARAFGYVREQFGDDKGEGRYSFAENEVRRLTAELNRDRAPGEAVWLPHQVQAAIWTAMKTRYELADVKARTNAKGIKDKLFTVDTEGKTVYPGDTAKDREKRNQHYANWRAFALKTPTDKVIAAANEASRSFADELQRMTETVTYEVLPAASLGHDINRASLAAKELFTAEGQAIVMGAEGQDLLAEKLGIALQYSTIGYGGFEKNVSPVILAHLLPKRTTGQKGFSVDEVRFYTRAAQFIYMQNAVPWFRPDNTVLTSQAAIHAQKFRVINTASTRTVKTFDTQDDATAYAVQKGEGFAVRGGELAKAVTFRFTSALTPSTVGEFLSTLESYLGPNAGLTQTAANEITVVNYRDDETKVPNDRTDEDFSDRTGSLIKDQGVRLGIESHGNLWIQGEYGHVQDWTNDIQGDRILNAVALSGRPDLHPWLHDRRADYEALLSRYSGDSLAAIERDLANNRLLQQAASPVDPRLQQAPTSTFYSHALNVLEDKMPTRASVAQIRGILSPENGVKAEELQWLGLDLFLQTQEQFTKDEVTAFVRANQVQVKTVFKGKGRDLAYADNSRVAPQFGKYQFPGGTNYTELLLTLPVKGETFTVGHWDEENVLVHIRFNERSGPHGERVLFLEEVQSDWHQKGRDEGYREAGFVDFAAIKDKAYAVHEEAKEKALTAYHDAVGPLVSVRDAGMLYAELKNLSPAAMSEARDQVNKVYNAAVAPAEADLKAAMFEALKAHEATIEQELAYNEAPLKRIQDAYKEAIAPAGAAFDAIYTQSRAAFEATIGTAEEAIQQAAHMKTVAPAKATLEAAVREASKVRDAALAQIGVDREAARYMVPDAPFKKTWHELAMKRMLRYAAEHGFDTLAWTVGSQQITRYKDDLRQNVDEIGWGETSIWANKGEHEVFSGDVDFTTGLFTSGPGKGKSISEVFGKALAEKIAASPTGTLSGDGLTVGGEGMKFFYDQQLPNFMKKYGKKWGATVSEMKLAKIKLPVHAVGITSAMQESVLQVGQPLFQTDQGAGPRGAFDPATLKTLLYEKADVSTVWHEMMHFYVEALMRVGTQPNATVQMQADVQALMELFQLPNAAAWEALTAEQQRPHHEAFAYLGEIYLWEGKAPSSALRAAFQRLALFMRQIYRAIRDELNGLYRAQFGIDLPMLTPEVRKVFDRMLAADEQIRDAEEMMKLVPLFQTQAQAGMSDAEWLAYKDLAQQAQQESISALTTASLRQMQWLSNAQSKYLKTQQAQHAALRTAIQHEVAQTLPDEPIYRALHWLKTGFMRGAEGQEIQATDGFKLDRAALELLYPTGDGRVDTDRLDWSAIRTLTKAGGLHPDLVAEMFGFPSGDQLVRTLLATPTLADAITARTDERMLREHSELTNPAAMKLAMDTALHTEARARLVAVELRHAAKATKPVRLLTAAAKQAAERFLETQQIKDIHASRYATAERQAGVRAEKAMKTGDGAAVTLALQQRLLNNQFVQQAAGIQEEVAAGLRYAKALQTDAAKKRMGADYADQIEALLEQFELGPMTLKAMSARTTLAQWVAQQEAKGLVPNLSPDLLTETRRVPYKMLTVGSFRELIAALKQIDHMGTSAQFLLTAATTTAYVEARDAIIASINAHARGRTAEARTPTTKIGRMVQGLTRFGSMHVKAATMARVLDGGQDGGPMWEYLIRTANKSGDQETQMTAEATLALTTILAPFLAKPMGGKGRVFPSVQRSFNRESLLAIALNTGNSGNLQRLLGGEGWTRDQITPLLQSLTAAEWQAVQAIWDHFESYKPQIAAKQRKLYGQEPDWIDPVPFTVQTSDGQQVNLRGGYYPIKYDPQASIQAETQADADAAAAQLRGAYTSATTSRSFTKARVEAVTGRPLVYTLAGLYSGVGEVIHDLAWHEWLIDANRLLRSSGIDQAIRTQYGPAWKSEFKSWAEANATGNRGVQQAGEQALSRLRQGISAAGIGFNIMSAALQITGFNQSIVRIGASWTARGIAKVLRSPVDTAREVSAKSTFMAHRSMTQFRELNEVKNRVEGDSGTLRTIHAGTYFAMMQMQRMVDVPTWWGAYEKGLAMGADEDTAIALADQAVIDSQGSGMVKDLSGVERGGPAMKLFTVFYAYMNTVFNLIVSVTMTATAKGKLTADYLMLGMVPVVLMMALKAALRPGDDEDWDWEKLAKQLAAEELSYLMGTMIVVREFQEAAKIVTGAEGAGRDYSGPAGIRIVADAVKFMKQASQGEFDTAFRKTAINLIGDIAGLPAAQLNRTIDGFEALTEGKTENPFALVMGYQAKR